MPDPTFRIRLKEYTTYSLNDNGYINNARLLYRVNDIGAAATADILRAVQTNAPATIEAAVRGTCELVTLPKADCCDVAVNYTPATGQKIDPKRTRKENDEKWTFEVSTGEITATTAISQVAIDDETTGQVLSADIGLMIGWNGKYGTESACSGVSIHTPSTRLMCRRTVAAATARTTAFETGIVNLQRHVNSSTFHGYAAGQVLFLGASVGEEYYNEDDDLLVDVTYQFAVCANEAAQVIGDVTIPAKNGWDYAWTISEFDPVDGKMKVVCGVVSQVYDYADLTTLGIGGSGGGGA